MVSLELFAETRCLQLSTAAAVLVLGSAAWRYCTQARQLPHVRPEVGASWVRLVWRYRALRRLRKRWYVTAAALSAFKELIGEDESEPVDC